MFIFHHRKDSLLDLFKLCVYVLNWAQTLIRHLSASNVEGCS